MAGIRKYLHLPVSPPTLWVEWVYTPVGEEIACKGMKGKKIGGFPLRHDGNDGRRIY
jgi:hypothetical protein